MGVGNFFGLLPQEMQGSRLYGVELDSITGRIAKQLYPKADITVAGFETTDRKDFFDLAIGNVPFGQYQVNDRAYNKLGFSIHDYFFAKTLDQVRPGSRLSATPRRRRWGGRPRTARRTAGRTLQLRPSRARTLPRSSMHRCRELAANTEPPSCRISARTKPYRIPFRQTPT